MYSSIDNNVNLGGNQTVTGIKTFPNSPLVTTDTTQTIAEKKTFVKGVDCQANSAFSVIKTNITKGTPPASDAAEGRIRVYDKTGSASNSYCLGGLRVVYGTSGTISTSIQAFKPTNGSTDNASLQVLYPSSGDPYTYAPPSNVTNSILTTTGKSFNSYEDDGYLKLGNGLILQWGTIKITSYNMTGTTTFPTPFLSAVFAITSCGRRTDVNDGQGTLNIGTTMNKTQFNWKNSANSSGYNNRQMWFAIGV